MDRNSIIRGIGAVVGGVAYGYALRAALEYIIVAASLGTFMSFIVWLIAIMLAAIGGYYLGTALSRVLSDERLDGWAAKLRSLRTKVAVAE